MAEKSRALASFALIFLFVATVIAATMDADVRQASFDPKTSTAILEIRNFSSKNITAFNLSYEVVYDDGKTSHGERMVDFLPAMMGRKIDMGDLAPGSGALRPGGSAQESIVSSPNINGSKVTAINAVLDVVVYDDNSAVVTNRDAFSRVVAVRQATANTLAKEAAIFNKHLAAEEKDPEAAIETDLRSLLAYAEPRPNELMSIAIMGTLRDLGQMPKDSDKRDFLARYCDRKNKKQAEYAQGAKIEAVAEDRATAPNH